MLHGERGSTATTTLIGLDPAGRITRLPHELRAVLLVPDA